MEKIFELMKEIKREADCQREEDAQFRQAVMAQLDELNRGTAQLIATRFLSNNFI